MFTVFGFYKFKKINFLKKNKIKVFGPEKYAAKLEGSKSFMKKIQIICKI